MGVFSDSNLQIFLTLYHGSLVAVFFFDYIIRNTVRMILREVHWNYYSNIILGAVCIAVIIWAILSVWNKVRLNLLISFVILIIIFGIRIGLGVPENTRGNSNEAKENRVVFIAQVTVHLFGIIATWILASHSA